jgi:hypothetical protein
VHVAGDAGTFTMGGGTISGNKADGSSGLGGGVYLDAATGSNVTFTKNGGTIYGNDATDTELRNTVAAAASGSGHAAYIASFSSVKYKDDTAWPGDNLSCPAVSTDAWN